MLTKYTKEFAFYSLVISFLCLHVNPFVKNSSGVRAVKAKEHEKTASLIFFITIKIMKYV